MGPSRPSSFPVLSFAVDCRANQPDYVIMICDLPFKLYHLCNLPRNVLPYHFQTTFDDKNGYQHAFLHYSSQAYFTFQWQGFYFIFPTILFGQKATAFLYHKVGHAVSGVARSIGVPKLQYIAGQHVGVLFTTPLRMTQGPSLQEALAAAYIMCYLLVEAGHFIGLDKSQSTPLICMCFLGFVCDSKHQAFVISQDKRNKFATLREVILSPSFVTLKTIKHFWGEVIFFSYSGFKIVCTRGF